MKTLRSFPIALLVLVLLVRCDLTTYPAGAERMDPPELYREWWAEMEKEVGRRYPMDLLSWWVVPVAPWWEPQIGDYVVGEWFESNRIYIGGPWLMDEGLVKHEMLHAILQDTGHGHPLFEVYYVGAFHEGPFAKGDDDGNSSE